MGEVTLYRLSLWKTAWLLKNSFWNEVYKNEACKNNPFTCVPSSIIDDLITCVLQLTTTGSLKVTDLYHLLTSGRVVHFKLDDILMSSEEFVSILMSLSVACQNLRHITLRNVFFSDHYTSLQATKGYMKKAAVECVLSISPLLESIESCIEFDLKAVRNCEHLKVLKLNFTSKAKLSDFLEESDGHFLPNNSVTVLDIFEDSRNPVSYLDIVPILKYCTALTNFNADISRSLEYLHSEDLFKGTLSTQYNLQRCYLGSTHLSAGSASIKALHIATLTCPLVKEVDILANEHDVIYALSDFQNLASLLIQWESPAGGDFQLGVQLLLDKIGPNLKNLHLINFQNVDFAVIATYCTEIEEFKVEFINEFRGYDAPTECFKSLKGLYMENIEMEYSLCESTIQMLLSDCTNLTTLQMHCASSLNDKVLSKILQKNSLSMVKDAVILDASLSGEGVRSLITSLKKLEYLHFSSSNVLFEEAANIVHEINPLIIMRSDAG